MKDLQGSVVVITGAGSGIGRAVARAFAGQGARLHLVDIDGDKVEALRAEIAGQGGTVRAHRVDCSDAEAVLALAREIYAAEGRVDVLHNNAGVVAGGPVEKIPLADWRWQTAVNYWGVVHGVHAFVPRMIEQGGGAHIVNTASMAGLVGFPFVAPYTATKFAVVGLSEALGMELGVHGIRVTAVCPASVRTGVFSAARLALPDGWGERIVRGVDRVAAEPEWIASKVIEAVKKDRSVVILAREMAPLWWLKRLSIPAFQRAARALTVLALRWGRKRD